MSSGGVVQGSADEWFDEVATTLAAGHLASTAIVAIDSSTGRIVGATAAATDLLGAPLAADTAELGERGTVAGPDLVRLRAAVERWRPAADPQGIEETAHSWVDELTLHRPDGPHRVQLSLVHHQRPRVQGEIVLVTLVEQEIETGRVVPGSGRRSAELWSVMDREGRIVALDPGWTALWADPSDTLGTLTSMLVHPEDMAEILPAVRDLLTGRTARATYTVRLSADDGSWVPIHVDQTRMLTAGELLVVASNRIVDEVRSIIPPGLLTDREVQVVVSLFDGLRVTQMADRDGVSAHTIRNQLKSIYRKLDVTGQADLLARFHRPAAP